jgi:hypothetical protein
MNKSQRILFFCIGVVLGLMVVRHLIAGRSEKKQASEAFDAKRTIPGMLVDYAQEGRPVYGEGVLEAVTGPGAEGFAQTRRVLTGGRNRTDDNGVALPPDFLAITEYYATTDKLTANTPVKRYEFAFADRIRVTVNEPSATAKVYQAVKSLDANLVPDAGSRTAVTVRFRSPKLASVGDALAILKTLPDVVSAEPVKLDWTKEIKK